jgi:tetratricopeptide (TPR) repeat protein
MNVAIRDGPAALGIARVSHRGVAMMRHRSWRALGLAGLLALTGCATPEVSVLRADRGDLPPRAEVAGVPFHPQREQYCGPAALATVLGWSGQASQDALAAAVFTPGREGTLSHDLTAAAYRHGRLAVAVAGLPALLREVAAGHPVLVLQNLGLDWFPQWHYAVVVGYDLDAGELALRSGEERRRVVALDTFVRTWVRADGWAVVVLPPDRLPAGADEEALVSAAAGLERAGRAADAALAYATILDRWPDSLGALIGRGNALYAADDLARAEAAYRSALDRHSGAAVAWNNLADVLAAQGEGEAAMIAARRAVALGGPHAATYRQTLNEISGKRAQTAPAPS